MAAKLNGDRKKRYWKLSRWIVCGTGLMVGFVLVVAWILYRSAQSEPEFYRIALAVSQVENSKFGDQFETRLLDLQNAARSKKRWRGTFSDSEFNGWLATDLTEKFPESLPADFVSPRIQIRPNELKLAFGCNMGRWNVIVLVEADVFSTEVPGEIAIRIGSVRAGWIPIPVSSLADRVTESLRRAGIRVAWTELEGDPVAVLTLPPGFVKLGGARVELESIRLVEGSMELIGATDLEKD